MTDLAGLVSEIPPDPLLDAHQHRPRALMSLHQTYWFIRLRWALVAIALAALAIERFVTPAATRPGSLVIPVLALAIANLIWMGWHDVLQKRLGKMAADQPRVIRHTLLLANAQVSVDLLLLTLILRYTGGVENPMALFYLFHMGIGALLLRPRQAICQGFWAMALYAGLAVGEYARVVRPHWEFLPQFPCPGLYTRAEYVIAALAVMGFGVAATLYFSLHITGRLFERERRLRDARATLRRSEAAIFDLQQRRSRFLQTAAHQLKSPLATIDTLMGLLADGLVPSEATASTYEKIRQRCREGIQQVGELLTLARVQRSDPMRHRRRQADVAKVVSEVCERFTTQAEAQGIRLEYRAPGRDDWTGLVDPDDLADCVSNLIENAVKFTPAPGRVTVSLSAARLRDFDPAAAAADDGRPPGEADPAECVAITVADTGIGIDPDALAQARDPAVQGSIFDAFRRGNNALAAGIPGTGLGLAIVREVVEQAGGRIVIRSRKGEGSSFTVVLPMNETASEGPMIRETRDSLVILNPGESKRAPARGEAAPTTISERRPLSF